MHSLVKLLTISPLLCGPCMAQKGLSRCGAWQQSDPSLWSGDVSKCLYGQKSVNDTDEGNCMYKPLGGCHFCQRGSSAGVELIHTCVCTSQEEASQAIASMKAPLIVAGIVLITIGALATLFSLIRWEWVVELSLIHI